MQLMKLDVLEEVDDAARRRCLAFAIFRVERQGVETGDSQSGLQNAYDLVARKDRNGSRLSIAPAP